MARVLTDNLALAYAVESTFKAQPTSGWCVLEPNTIGTYGATITTVARAPISATRQRRKGTITDLDSAVSVDADFTIEHFLDFIEGFMFASATGCPAYGAKNTYQITAVVGSTTDAYTKDSDTITIPTNCLIYVRGCAIAGNNGIKIVEAGGSATSVPVTTDLTAETIAAGTNAILEVCGYRGAASDIEIDANGNIISTTVDFTTLYIQAGQVIWVGGETTDTRFALDISDGQNRGYVRVLSVAAHLITIDTTKGATFALDDGNLKTIELYYGRFIRNVAVTDASYIERSYHFEMAYADLGGVDTPEYEYSAGNMANELAITLPLADKATMSFGFVGTDTEPPTATQATGADSPISPLRNTALNTSADIARLRLAEIDETGMSSDFKSLTFRIKNGVTPEKALATLGALYMNAGMFEVDAEAQMIFTDSDVAAAIRNNTTVTMDFSLRNEDGAVFFDIPSLTLSGGDKELPTHESVLVNITGMAFEDATLGFSLGISLFPYVPAS